MQETDRRSHKRTNLARPCKLFDPKSGKYISGTVWNLSDGGAYLEVNRQIRAEEGDSFYLGIAVKRRQGMLHRDEMFLARVVRSQESAEGRSTLGVQFADRFIGTIPVEIKQAA